VRSRRSGAGLGGDGSPEWRDRRCESRFRRLLARTLRSAGDPGQADGKAFFEPKGRVHAHEACPQLASGEEDGRVEIEVDGDLRGPAFLGFHQAVEVSLGPAGVPGRAAEHQLSLPRRSAATERKAR
jgi:hypothetical protein